jgi:hypothetical protein
LISWFFSFFDFKSLNSVSKQSIVCSSTITFLLLTTPLRWFSLAPSYELSLRVSGVSRISELMLLLVIVSF